MRSVRLLGVALTTAALLAVAPAWADPPHHAKGKGPPAHAGGPNNRDAPPPGWQKKAWRRGERLQWAEVDRRYWVDDYAHYRLRDPGRGERWVRQSDSEYLLVEIATGLIIDALHR
ncbi:RcnB family protein [Stenotrophomonas lacuserhaii]|uniref:RcnB family protein n=1 Tax=Stenotrophomonas lacuserhaii TaxID=2760084 RepID=UPI0015F7DDCD|nr:RcnB family protein [Stenotrophomonas lacuserhaii]